MMQQFCVLVFLLILTNAESFAQSTVVQPPRSKDEFCQLRKDPNYFFRLAHEKENQMAFENYGGAFDGGVCWWHSLFQRSSLYLSVYRPDQARPNLDTAKKIIHSIATNGRVVEIPGYRNFLEFSRDWEDQIQYKLQKWQLV
ncbi:MAG: hypothetical protein IT289_02855, partial [Oligoflexia bacterium]|nr:hypothetical protein [Oligoflexia bacterium]